MYLILIIQLSFMFVGLLTVVGAVAVNSLMLVAAGHFILGLVGIAHIWVIIANRTLYWSLCDIHAASLLISYFGGSAVTLSLSEGGIISGLTISQLATIFDATMFIVVFVRIGM